MRLECKVPNDSMFQMEGFVADLHETCREFLYPGIGKIIAAPTAYYLKDKDILGVELSATHPAWMHSGMNYDDFYIRGICLFRKTSADLGEPATAFVPNPKRFGQAESMAGGLAPSSADVQFMDNIPMHYYGGSLEKKKPGQSGPNTFLTKIINEDAIKVTCLSPFEYEIEVLSDLQEDEWFYIPDWSAKGLANSMWGKAGKESTLPDGASAGLIKMASEAIFRTNIGQYLVTGKEYAAVTAANTTLFEKTEEAGEQYAPSWWTNIATTTIESLPHYQTLKSMVDTEKEYFACGYDLGCSTVGTGIFVSGNTPKTLSYGKTSIGIKYKRQLIQQGGTITRQQKFKEILDCEDFLERTAKTIVSEAEVLPDDIVIPLCASELQYEKKKDAPNWPYTLPQYPAYNYTYLYHNTIMPASTTPTYIPAAETFHCYIPNMGCPQATRVSLIRAVNLDADITLTLKADPSWLQPSVQGYAPERITKNCEIVYTPGNNPSLGYHRDQFGYETYRRSGVVSTMTKLKDYYGRIKWINPDLDPTIGGDATTTSKTNNVMFAGMVMAFMGVFKKGTKKGKYLWKPFKSVQTAPGCLHSVDPQYIPTAMVAKIKPDTTTAPFIGTNIISAEFPNIDWLMEKKTDGNYEYWQVLKNVWINRNVVTRIWDSRFLTIDQDTVPLIGYPMSKKPMMMDIDDWAGDAASEVGDIAMTNPFYDKTLKQWIVIAASAQMKKFYRVDVEVDEKGRYVTQFLRVRDSKELFDTPYGRIVEVLGICQTRDTHYFDGTEDDHLVIYGRTEPDESARVKGSNLIIATCRTYMEWDAHKDSISRVRISDVLPEDFQISDDINWPRSVAVMYPYIYILGFCYSNTPTKPKTDPLVEDAINITGEGWQTCLWKVDITSGIINDVIPLIDVCSLRFTYGIPARHQEAYRLWRSDYNTLGGVMKYAFGVDNFHKLPVSEDLPKKSKGWDLPSIAGLCHVSGQLMAFSNYGEKLCLINPITGCLEEMGTNIFPFTYPFNSNVSSNGEMVSAISRFGGKNFYSVHPFFHVCIGDGLPPNKYGAGIDVQDVTQKHKLLRMLKLKNNLLRDRLEKVELSVPDPSELPHSEMLWLSRTGLPDDKVKKLVIEENIPPAGTAIFYLHVEPEEEIDGSVLLYLNAKFGRVTEFFGYRLRIGEVQ